jgi:ABC-type histidine transport system ATPase subunit
MSLKSSFSIARFVFWMEGGRILEEGTPQAIFSNPQQARTQAFLQSIL